jgi:hypothetical protein
MDDVPYLLWFSCLEGRVVNSITSTVVVGFMRKSLYYKDILVSALLHGLPMIHYFLVRRKFLLPFEKRDNGGKCLE